MDKGSFKSIPFWSWNGKLEKEELKRQIAFMKDNGCGGFIMHARGGLKTEYLGQEWLEAIKFCADEAEKQGLNAWIYDENGWPSGFAGGKLLEQEENRDKYLLYSVGKRDADADYVYRVDGDGVEKVNGDYAGEVINVFVKTGVATADICNKKVVDKFIALTHEKYAEYFGEDFSKKIVGFFTDEPQYYRWHTPFTVALEEYFKREYGEDVYDGLGYLFADLPKSYAFRWKYWSAMQALMLENFAENIHGWCKAHGVLFTGHYIEEKSLTGQMTCCAGIMPFYEHMDFPGMDWLTRRGGTVIAPKQLTSAAAQLGKERILTESFACCGWDVLPKELKYIGDFQYIEGVNLLCQHLVPYSEAGQRKRDHPEHFTPRNPWINAGFKKFNEYFEKFGEFTSNAEEVVNVAVLQPITSAYLFYKRYDENGRGIRELDEKFIGECEDLTKRGIPYHFIDEVILKRHGLVEGDLLKVGEKTYEYVVLPTVYNLNKSTAELLKSFIANGGKVVLLDGVPQYLQGEKADFSWLKTNCDLKDVVNGLPYAISGGENLRVSYRKNANGEYLVCLNCSDSVTVADITLKAANSLEEISFIGEKPKFYGNKVEFKPKECKVLKFKREVYRDSGEKKTFTLNAPLKVVRRDDNTLTLDKCRYSFDGKNYGKEVFAMGAFQKMLEIRYDGELWLEYDFHVKVKPEKIRAIAEDTNVLSFSVNDNLVERTDIGDADFYGYDISPYVKVGKNTITLKMKFFEKDEVYYALFGDGVTEGLKNCLVYDTTIENIYLTGDFGVYSDTFRKGEEPNVYVSDGDFYIGERKSETVTPILDGEPFFAGKTVYVKRVNLSGAETTLKLGGRFHYASVKVNGKPAGELLFGNEIDLGGLIVEGENEIEITAYNACRNKFGPFHYKDAEEPISVAPKTFELFGTWEDGVSSKQTSEYRFVSNFVL